MKQQHQNIVNDCNINKTKLFTHDLSTRLVTWTCLYDINGVGLYFNRELT